MPHRAAISRWVMGRPPPRPKRMRMMSASRGVRQVSTHWRTFRQASLVSRSSSMLSSTLITSIRDRALPSLSISMESDRETSPCSFRVERKYIRISFAILS